MSFLILQLIHLYPISYTLELSPEGRTDSYFELVTQLWFGVCLGTISPLITSVWVIIVVCHFGLGFFGNRKVFKM